MALDVTSQVMRLVIADSAFVVLCLLLLIPLARLKPATYAVLKRNLFGYFNNPTGYVFICLYVLVASGFAFWPLEFFNANLATLSELNSKFPLVMLLFIPTITMSIWADERRQGTDELLLTIPATDWDIVLGKYLAVASIYTFSLLFSQIANFTVLNILALGDLDTGLFVTTYLGYWLIGLAMLALGMAASFLTSNLTVGFILGVLFNLPLVFAANAELIVPSAELATSLSRWSYAAQFEDFGRGVVSLKSVVFYAMIIVIGLYLSIVLIGRRHWYGGKDGNNLLGHYVVRALSLIVLSFGVNSLLAGHDIVRRDFTTAQISSLSDDTRTILKKLDPKHPILIEAFISNSVPKEYTKTRLDLITMLNEFAAQGRDKITVHIFDNLEPFSPEASRAEEQYGINAETVVTQDRGAFKQEPIFLAAAFRSGLEKVVVPFFDHGIPVEYELIRSINTVAQSKRPRIGVLRTDAQLFGGFDMQRMQPRPKQLIIEELEKQYEVVEVDPNSPIEKFDVLMAVQPSSLTPPQLENLIDSIRAGQPTAIFEDPFPIAMSTAPGTGQPKQAAGGGMFGGGAPPEPKGDITRLWSMLGVTMEGRPGFGGGMFDARIVFQEYNPYPKARSFDQFTPEWVFASDDSPGAQKAISDNPITKGLHQLLFLYSGAVKKDGNKEGMEFEPLVSTGTETGTVEFDDIRNSGNNPNYLETRRRKTNDRFVLAAKIKGKVKADAAEVTPPPTGKDDPPKTGGEGEVNVVLITDIDLLHSQFLLVRARPDGDINWQFDNVPFVLNVLDVLANDNRLVEIRKRQTRHSTLKMIDAATEAAHDDFAKNKADFEKKFTEAKDKAQGEMDNEVKKFQDDLERIQKGGNPADLKPAMVQFQMKQQVAQRRYESTVRKLEQDRDRKLKMIKQDLSQETVKVQNWFKGISALLPPIPPLIVGLMVYWRRRQRELVGVIDERRR